MKATETKIKRGMEYQLSAWRNTLASGYSRIGWKIGFNMPADQQRLRLPSPMIGFLSSNNLCLTDRQYAASGSAVLLAEPEVAIQLGQDVDINTSKANAFAAITCLSSAIELVDTTRSVNDDIEEILKGNLFHEKFVLSEKRLPATEFDRGQLTVSLSVNQVEVRSLEQERVPKDFSEIVCTVANILAAHGERLKSGDWIITGSACKAVSVRSGDKIEVDMGMLGKTCLNIV